MAEATPPQAKDTRALKSPARGVSALLARTDSTPGAWVKSFVIVALGLVVGAIVTGSGPAAILAIVLALCAAQAQFSAPNTDHEAKLRVLPADGDGDARTARAELTLSGGNETGRAIIEVTFPGTRPQTIVVAYSSQRKIRLSAPSLRSGPRASFTVRLMAVGPTGDWFGIWETLKLPNTLVMAPVKPLSSIPASATTVGLTGPRTSRRRGEGFEFRDISPMTWGDSVRRIDWKASAKLANGEETLYVRRNLAQAESTTFILLDSRDEVGPEVLTWGSAHEIRSDHRSSLDLAREAATAIAQRAITQGDRVGFEDISRPRRPLLPATGHRQFMRLQHAIAMAAPLGAPTDRVRAPMVPTGAIVYVMSTFLDDASLRTVGALVKRGHRVIAVDTLPRVSLWNLSQRHTTAFRLISLARDARLRNLKAFGVPLVEWAAQDSTQQLMQYARVMATNSAARKMAR